eukprot:scaffold283716_cov34-Prasinocladus_malaysianus.AAC.1
MQDAKGNHFGLIVANGPPTMHAKRQDKLGSRPFSDRAKCDNQHRPPVAPLIVATYEYLARQLLEPYSGLEWRSRSSRSRE